MGQVLYRKYRSKSLQELVGQDHITEGLARSISAGLISHAYLFTGPRGTGKTSIARILAHELNGFDYDDPCSHMDIIEIDAASNRRIDEIRDLRDKVHIAPTTGKYKVYIIDEVHMLTKEAFNALLKTLEEPPEHAIFMLATTELHKVPETIISRTQRYSLKPIEKSYITSHLRAIADQENIKIDDDALDTIADHAAGGFRDAISLLDQIRHNSDHISIDTVAASLGIPPRQLIQALWEKLSTRDSSSLESLKNILELGFHAPKIASELLSYAIESRNIELAEQLLEVENSGNPEMKLRLVIIGLSDPLPVAQTAVPAPPAQVTKKSTHREVPKVAEKEHNPEVPQTNSQDLEQPEAVPTEQNGDAWPAVLESIREAGHSVYGPLRLAEASFENNVLKLRLRFPFHIKRIAETQNMKLIADTFEKITGQHIKIDVAKTEPNANVETKKSPEPAPEVTLPAEPIDSQEMMSDPLSIVKNVFGNAEVL